MMLAASLLGITSPSQAEEPFQVFINGVQLAVQPTAHEDQLYYPGDELAKALGASFQATPNGYTLNGFPIKPPPLMSGGRAFLTLNSAVKALGGSILRDPVRHQITVTCGGPSGPGGIPYYSADYKTPEQQAEEEREQNLRDAGLASSGVWLSKKRAELTAMYPKTVSVLDRVPQPLDFAMPSHPWSSPNGADPYVMPDGTPKSGGPTSTAMAPSRPAGYLSRTCENGVYRVSVTDAKISEALRGISPDFVAAPGTKYVVITLTEENQSKAPQPTAWFALRDAGGNQYVADYSLSQFPRGQLRARETSTGFIIFQIPSASQPSTLEVLCTPPLVLSLTM